MSTVNKDELILAGDEVTLAGASESEVVLAGMKASNSPSSKQRKEFLSRLEAFPSWVKKGLKDKTLQIVDVTFFGMANLGTGTIRVFKTDDDIVDNVRNIDKARIPRERPLLLTHLEVQQSAADIATGFDAAQYTGAFKRSELKVIYDKFPIIEKELIGTFVGNNVNGYNIDKVYGEVELKNPKVLLDEKQIEVEILIPNGVTIAGAALVALKGISVMPYSVSTNK